MTAENTSMFVVRQLRSEARPQAVASALRWQQPSIGGRPAFAIVRDEAGTNHLLERTGKAIAVKRDEYVEVTLEPRFAHGEQQPSAVLRGTVTHVGRGWSLAAHAIHEVGALLGGVLAACHGGQTLLSGGNTELGVSSLVAGVVAFSVFLRNCTKSSEDDREVVKLSFDSVSSYEHATKLTAYTDGKARVVEERPSGQSDSVALLPAPTETAFCLSVDQRVAVRV